MRFSSLFNRHHMFTVRLALMLIFVSLWHQVLATEFIQPLTLNFRDSWSESDAENSCDSVRTGQTGIFAFGATGNRFLLISTDLFVYELPLDQQDPEKIPPFKVLITGKPVHLRDRWPDAHKWLVSHSSDILYAFVTNEHLFKDYEYLVFAFNNKTVACLVALDLNSGALVNGPCSVELKRQQVISTGLPMPMMMVMVLNKLDGGQRTCIEGAIFSSGKPETQVDYMKRCDTIDKCFFSTFSGSPSSQLCSDTSVVAGFIYRNEKLFLIDSTGTVQLIHYGPAFTKVDPQPLKKFIGCNEDEIIKLQMQESWLWIVIALAVLLQLLICGVAFFVFGRMNQLPSELDVTSRDGKRKSRKRSKSKSLSPSRSGRSSLHSSSKSGKSKSISRKSSKSASKSVSMQRPSVLGLSRGSSKASSMTLSKSSKRSPSNKSSFSKDDRSNSHFSADRKGSK